MLALVGGAAEVAKQIEAYNAAGVSYHVLNTQPCLYLQDGRSVCAPAWLLISICGVVLWGQRVTRL